jgi:D-3-phosphoglycerate dehydrogenase
LFAGNAQSYISNSVLEGFLSKSAAQPVNVVNSRALAKDQGLAVEERSEGKSRYFVNMLKVELTDAVGSREVGGAIRGRSGLRLVSLNNYHFDAVLEGNMIIIANRDRPGMIGVLGTILGSHKVNISYMSVGRDQTGGTAISVVNVDQTIPREALEDLRAQEGILWVKSATVD